MKHKHQFDHSKFVVPSGKYTPLAHYDPGYTGDIKSKEEGKKTLIEDVKDLSKAQELIWATRQYSVVIIFQAMDAAGKDGTIKHVMSGVNPQGCDVFGFKAPTEEERLHHFLWRPQRFLPPKGKIAIFNRSYYEEVLVVRVHPEILNNVWLPAEQRNMALEQVWQIRYDEINEFEERLSRNGTLIIKFFLNVSKDEQLRRFLDRLTKEGKQWKCSPSDFTERKLWDEYQVAYEKMLNATSTALSPWYVIPADNKWYMRAVVADIIANRVNELKLDFPTVTPKKMKELMKIKGELEKELKRSK